jgi:hypothetical protein
MAIHTEETKEITSGFAKGIEASAVGLIMQNLQKSQYQYPVKSTIREIVCNGIDSIVDRNAALDILNGAPVSKYFAEDKADAVFQDSRFNPEYYDPKWLSNDEFVYITYKEGENQEKDCIVIHDNGTGLGGKRLEGYFQLGYSTKRLSKLSLGKFGIGAKSALSVGVQFYNVVSRYNGMKFSFNIYSADVNSIVPKFNLDTGIENPFVWFGTDVFDSGGAQTQSKFKVYYEPTEEMNGLTITIEAKKHHKAQYVDAVKSQLLYFPNIQFNIQNSFGLTPISYKAGIIYEDEFIVLSDNNMWSKPHLLLNNVNYGYINFEELEMEDKSGNIGIKVRPEDIEVNPSRESVIWSEETKAMVLTRFKNVVGIATEFIQRELEETDFVKWFRVCYQISARSWDKSSTNIVNRLASIIDISQIEPSFPPDSKIKFSASNLFNGFLVRQYYMQSRVKVGRAVNKVEREVLSSGLSSYNHLPMVIIDGTTSVRKDKWLLQRVYTSGFVGIKAPDWIGEDFSAAVILTEQLLVEMGLATETSMATMSYSTLNKLRASVRTAPVIWDWLQKSKEVIWYSAVIVPEDFVASEVDEEEEEVTEEDKEVVAKAKQTDVERRKIEGKTVLSSPAYYYSDTDIDSYSPKIYSYTAIETKIADIGEWDNEEVYYATGTLTEVPDQDKPKALELEMMEFAAFITRNNKLPINSNYGSHHWHNDQLRLIKVAQANVRLYRDFKPIQQFFMDVKNGRITMSNSLIRWNTARLIANNLKKAAFLWNFETFNKEKSDQYKALVAFVDANWNEVGKYCNSSHSITRDAYNSLIAHLDKVHQFQNFVATKPSADEISAVATELFGTNILVDGQAVDPAMWNIYTELMEYAEPIAGMLNELPILTGINSELIESDKEIGEVYNTSQHRVPLTPCEQVEQEIRGYLQYKGVS